MTQIRLIVGLGNPGDYYRGTRHNLGAKMVEKLAQSQGIALSQNEQFFGKIGKGEVYSKELRLLIPSTFMNLCGKSIASYSSYFDTEPASILVVHDELDVLPGQARLKFDGGHGGHNGLRDIIPALGGSRNFWRLRLGIGHPGHARDVSKWVLTRPSKKDQKDQDLAIDASFEALRLLMAGDPSQAMNLLHSFRSDTATHHD